MLLCFSPLQEVVSAKRAHQQPEVVVSRVDLQRCFEREDNVLKEGAWLVSEKMLKFCLKQYAE